MMRLGSMPRWAAVAAGAAALMAACGCSAQNSAAVDPARSRLGINLAGPADWSTEHAFVDVFRMARPWISQREGAGWGQGPKLDLDAKGWVRRLEPGCYAETLLLTAGHAPSGEYICLYEGQGEIELAGAARALRKEPGRIVAEVESAKGAVFLRLRSTNPANPVRRIRFLMPGHEKTFEKEPFNPAFLARWRGFNTVRFMDWMHTNNSRISRWTERPTREDATWAEKGVPLEVMLDLCNRLGANGWFCMPHLADDDYVRQFARMTARGLKPPLKAYVEYSNEIWNSMFEQTRYAGDRGLALKLAEKHWEAAWRYLALRSLEIFRIWEQEFGGRQRLVRVIASQAANAYISEQKLTFQDAYKQCDALAIAPYISFNIAPRASEGTPGAEEVAGWTVDQLLDYVEQKALPECIGWMRAQKRLADRLGVGLVCYEAGQHLVGVGGAENNEKLTALFKAANRHPRMYGIYMRYMDAWKELGGGLMALFSSTGEWSKWGSWGLAEYMEDTPQTMPKLRAALEWNRANPR